MSVPRISWKRLYVDEDPIGEGSFGSVYRGEIKPPRGSRAPNLTVAVKVLRDGDEAAFDEEVYRMGRLDHPNILKIIATSTLYGNACIITEFMPLGSLISYLWNNPNIKAEEMINYAHGIATGMEYLHHKMGQKHCDLAARNCLVGNNWQIKIGDFGKYDGDHDEYYYNGNGDNAICPLRWMSPENVPTWQNGFTTNFNKKGDVWAFGVVLFEIFTKGRIPYEKLDTDKKVFEALENGETPIDYFDVKARGYILDLMNDCWEIKPQDRPSFKAIKRTFEECDPEIVRA